MQNVYRWDRVVLSIRKTRPEKGKQTASHGLTARQPSGITSLCRRTPPTLRQADQARTDLAAIESNLEFIMSQLAGVQTRNQLARYSMLLMVGTACLVQTLALLFR